MENRFKKNLTNLLNSTETKTSAPLSLCGNKNLWLYSRSFDLTFIVAPSFLSVFFVLFFSDRFAATNDIPLWAWVVFVLCIDVSHVYSSLFRTYFNKKEFNENKTLYTLLPVIVFLVGVFLYSLGANVFWRILAYTAVFHFIRQQYGFMRLYSRNMIESNFSKRIDALVIYISTLYPILYWHTHLPRNFRWFTDGDFIRGIPIFFERILLLVYIVAAITYLVKEIRQTYLHKNFNFPKNLIIIGTALSWYIGIVLLNGDMAFTITNVVSHGIPYMALVWAYGKKQADKDDTLLTFGKLQYKVFFSRYSFPIFIASLIVFGYIEEGLWAGLVWREHLEVFGIFANLPAIRTKDTLNLIVPLLTLPQATHYVLDGFIWRLRDNESNWYKVLFDTKV